MVSAGTATRGRLRPSDGSVLVRLRVSPGAKTNSSKGPYGESAIRLSVASPPVDGEANAEVERFLANSLGVRVSDVTVVYGASSRDKFVLVRGEDEILGRLRSLL